MCRIGVGVVRTWGCVWNTATGAEGGCLCNTTYTHMVDEALEISSDSKNTASQSDWHILKISVKPIPLEHADPAVLLKLGAALWDW